MNGQVHSGTTCPEVTAVLLKIFVEHRKWNPDLKPMEFMNRRWKGENLRTAYANALDMELGRAPSRMYQ